MIRSRLVAAVIAVLTCGEACRAATETAAGARPAQFAPPVAELSTLVVPIRVNLAALLPLLEKQVPSTFRDSVTERRVDVDYAVVRERITLRMIGAGLHASTVARYQLRACPPRLPCVSCGISQPMRRAEITLQSTLSWDSAWRLRSRTRALPTHFPDRCALMFARFDITDRFIAPVVNQQLREAAKSIDRNMPGVTNLRPTAQEIWTSLQAPTQIAPRTWLLFEPVEVSLGSIRGEGMLVTSTLALQARTRVIVGEKPPVAARGLPSLRIAEAAGGLRVPFDLHLPYEEASRLATAQFGHRTYKLRSGELRIEALRLRPAGGAKVAVEADINYRGGFLKRYAGPVVLEGTPRYDAATKFVMIDGLDYTIGQRRKNLFFRMAERAAHDNVRSQLQQSARFPLRGELDTVRAEIAKAITRRLAAGVTMQGTIDSVEPQAVFPAAEDLVVRVLVTGKAAIEVTQLTR